MMMKLAAALLLLYHSAAFATSQEACCLCGESCAEPEKVDMITVSPFFDAPQATTCGELARDLLLDSSINEEDELCAQIRSQYQTACCSSGKDKSQTTA